MVWGFVKHVLQYFKSDTTSSPKQIRKDDRSILRAQGSNDYLPIYDSGGRLVGLRMPHAGRPEPTIHPPVDNRKTPGLGESTSGAQGGTPTLADVVAAVLKTVGHVPQSSETAASSTPAVSPSSTSQAAHPSSVAPDEWDGWPDGWFERTFTNTEVQETNNLAVHWACEVSGSKSGSDEAEDWRKGRKTERRCKGVLKCTNEGCGMLARPQTRTAQIRKQLEKPCLCGGSLVRLSCGTVQRLWRFKHGIHYIHEGLHDHPRPNHLLHLNPRQQQQFQALVEGNPKCGPLKLLVGVPSLTGPGKSALDISPILINKDRIAYEAKKVRQGAQSSNAPDQLSISEFSQFCTDHPGLIIHSVIGVVTVISMQQPLMLAELVKETRITSEPVNGIVSDAAHGFWVQRNSLLIISSGYSLTLRCWIPGILSYSNGASSEHYRHHFLALFHSIARERTSRGWDTSNDEDFGNVVDFSEAERNGFIEAFIEFRQHEGSTRSVDALRTAAEGLLRGCRQHFDAGVTRLARIGGVIPPGEDLTFRRLTKELVEAEDLETFRVTAETIHRKFPLVRPWLEWWMRDAHASMLFNSQRRMDPILWNSIPSTTNAEEAMHWKIYSGVGRDHKLMEGLYALYKFAEHYDKLLASAMDGQKIRYGRPERWKIIAQQHGRTKLTRKPHLGPASAARTTRKSSSARYHNDGRPPDRAKDLLRSRSSRSKGLGQPERRSLPLGNTSPARVHVRKQTVLSDSDLESTTVEDSAKDSDHDSDSCTEWNGFSDTPTSPTGPLFPDAPRALVQTKSKATSTAMQTTLGGILPSYAWSGNSCWLDSALETVWHVALQDYGSLQRCFVDISGAENAPIYQLFCCIDRRRTLFLEGSTNYTVAVLTEQRDAFRAILTTASPSKPIISSPSSHENVFGWINSILTLSRHPDTDRFASIRRYFHAYFVRLRTCSGDPNAHSDLRSTFRYRFHFILETEALLEAHGHRMESWLRDVFNVKPTPMAMGQCWRNTQDYVNKTPGSPIVHRCSGSAALREIFVSVPVMLIVETPLVGWDYPEKIVLCRKGGKGTTANRPEVIFDLVSRVFHAPDLGPHYTSRHILKPYARNGGQVVSYDDIANSGTALVIPGSKVSTHLAGPDDSLLPPLPPNFSTSYAVYHLRGGAGTQEAFYRYSIRHLEDNHHVSPSSYQLNELHNARLTMSAPNVRVVPKTDCLWLSKETQDRERYIDYEAQGHTDHNQRKNARPSTRTKPTSPSLVKPTRDEAEVVLLDEPQQRIPSPHPVRCRCGVVGDGNLMIDGLNTVQCVTCDNYSHIACQRNGRANDLPKNKEFECDECTGRDVLPDMLMRNQAKPRRKLPPRSLSKRLWPGKAALAKCGDFWYPVRLLQLEQKTPQRVWLVHGWRLCSYAGAVPAATRLIVETELVDELWQDVKGRRAIRLGRWELASMLEQDEDILAYPERSPFTPEIDAALKPHGDTLTALLTWEPGHESTLNPATVPVLGLLKAQQQSSITAERFGLVPFVGNLDLTTRAQIHNWLDNNLPGARQSRHLWMGRHLVAHAITLLLAARMRDEDTVEDEQELLKRAWNVQTGQNYDEAQLRAVDVDAESLRALESRMFERSAAAGNAGWYQWGLNAGDHQDGWDPYDELPNSWNHGDFYPEDPEELLERGTHYISISEGSGAPASASNQSVSSESGVEEENGDAEVIGKKRRAETSVPPRKRVKLAGLVE